MNDEQIRVELRKLCSGGDNSKSIIKLLRKASLQLLCEIAYARPLGEDIDRMVIAKAELKLRNQQQSHRNYWTALITLVVSIMALFVSIYKK